MYRMHVATHVHKPTHQLHPIQLMHIRAQHGAHNARTHHMHAHTLSHRMHVNNTCMHTHSAAWRRAPSAATSGSSCYGEARTQRRIHISCSTSLPSLLNNYPETKTTAASALELAPMEKHAHCMHTSMYGVPTMWCVPSRLYSFCARCL